MDNDCDGETDEGMDNAGCVNYHPDVDADFFVNKVFSACLCEDSAGDFVLLKYAFEPGGPLIPAWWMSSNAWGPDCDDSNAKVHPGAPELCNGVDDDCNGVSDDKGAPMSCVEGDLSACTAGCTPCGPGLANIDGDSSNGCECSFGPDVDGNTCKTAVDTPLLKFGESISITDGLPPGDPVDWYGLEVLPGSAVGIAPDCWGQGVRVSLSDNPDGVFALGISSWMDESCLKLDLSGLSETKIVIVPNFCSYLSQRIAVVRLPQAAPVCASYTLLIQNGVF